jgi:hypothetical protein
MQLNMMPATIPTILRHKMAVITRSAANGMGVAAAAAANHPACPRTN